MDRCGVFSISGRPNVGKSTLFNRLLKTHLSAVTPKPRTTRANIRGIHNADGEQLVLVDTPGVRVGTFKYHDRSDAETAQWALESADLVTLVVEHKRWLQGDQNVLERIIAAEKPCVLVLNKVDLVRDKQELLAAISDVSSRYDFVDICPISALRDSSLDGLLALLTRQLPAGEFLYKNNEITDRKQSELASEMVREQFMRELNQELPYVIDTVAEVCEIKNKILHVHILTLVERDSQRLILLGKSGARLKRVSVKARKSIEAILGIHVFLRIWIKVKPSMRKEAAKSSWDLRQ